MELGPNLFVPSDRCPRNSNDVVSSRPSIQVMKLWLRLPTVDCREATSGVRAELLLNRRSRPTYSGRSSRRGRCRHRSLSGDAPPAQSRGVECPRRVGRVPDAVAEARARGSCMRATQTRLPPRGECEVSVGSGRKHRREHASALTLSTIRARRIGVLARRISTGATHCRKPRANMGSRATTGRLLSTTSS